MASKDGQELEFPQFPSLAKCILVDARHGSRSDLVKDINASGLFLTIVEAKSIQNGLGMLEYQHSDALFLGPSVSPETMADFLKQGKKRAISEDCAYMAILDADASEAQVKALFHAGAHNVIRRPFNRHQFFEAVVQAVVKANANSPWTTLFNRAVEQGVFGAIQIVEGPTEHDPGAVTQLSEGVAKENAEASVTIQSSSERLREILVGLERGLYSLDPSGVPTRRTIDALNEVALEMEKGSALQEQEIADFHNFVLGALQEWFIGLVEEDKMVATEKLRQKLLAYVPKR